MKVAITDYTFPDLAIETEILTAAGCQIVSAQCKTPDELIELTSDADYVITQFAPVDSVVIGAMRNVKAIVRYGIGYDNVDCAAARARGVPVCNIPGFCIDEVADHTLAFILAATRALAANHNHLCRGHWGKGVPLERMRALRGLTVGLIGLGRIGEAVARRLGAFGCRLLALDPARTAEELAAVGCVPATLAELLAESDVVSLHCPATPETRGIINQDSLAEMRDGAILINVGRGELVQTDDLVAALQSGKLAAASLDVFDPEPLPPDHPLLAMDNVVVSAHLASASPTAARTLRESAARLVVSAINGEPLTSVVNGV